MISRCSICDGKCNPVKGDGPEPASVLFIGERPGWEENKLGRPFIGKSGRELNENYLWRAGLSRPEIRITNTVKCFAEGNRKPTPREIEECSSHHLPDEINACCPAVIVLLGASACSLVPDINLDVEHGIPREAKLFDWEGTVIPMYHPAAGMHDTSKMIPLLEDFDRMGKWLDNKWQPPTNAYPHPDYRVLRTWHEYDKVLAHSWKANESHKLVAIDTERHGNTPFSLQFSFKPGTGYMLLCADEVTQKLTSYDQLWDAFRQWVRNIQGFGWEIVLHNAPQDLDWLDRMGVKVNRFRDTMQEAYQQGNLPQGLKALAYRLFGVRMTAYEDIVLPYSRSVMSEWMLNAVVYAAKNLRTTEHKQLKTKVKVIEKPGEIERGLSRIYRYTLNNPEYDPWKKTFELFKDKAKTGDLTEAELEFIDSILNEDKAKAVIDKLMGGPGVIPEIGIAHVPLEIAKAYACADADLTLRVALELDDRRKLQTGTAGNVLAKIGVAAEDSLVIADGDEDK